ncbi:MAG: rod shape-determining protein MreC [Pseudomonadota bacterium]
MAEQTFFIHNRTLALQLAFFAGLSLLLLVLDYLQVLKPVRSALGTLTYPLQMAVGMPVTAAQWLSNSLADRDYLLSQQERLQAANKALHGQLRELGELQRENERLRKLLRASRRLQADIQIAEVMPIGLEPFSRKIKINQGFAAGIKEGFPVMDAGGILGQVVQVEALACTVMLITDPNHTLPVEVSRNKLQTLAQGSGVTGDLSLLYLQNTADIQVGDRLVTSGRGGKFPEGHAVGVVTEIKRDISHTYLEARARPLALMERSREVFIMLHPSDARS